MDCGGRERLLPFRNRLRKNFRHFSRWAKKQGLTAYRVYDRDLPEFPFAVDWYDGRVHLQHYPRSRSLHNGVAASQENQARQAVLEALGVGPERIFCKTHVRKVWGREQYQRLAYRGEAFVVEEQGLKFWVNLSDYLDTGLFLDHRLTRASVREQAAGRRFLNLFSYTGSFTVYAAAGGAASTTSVDLSRNYLDWLERNLALNRLSSSHHRLIDADVVSWARRARDKGENYDLIALDPPPFSASKRSKRRFEIQRDHPRLLADVAQLLAPGGTLYFSTSFQGFEPHFPARRGLGFEEITARTLPPDFRRAGAHRCWRFVLG